MKKIFIVTYRLSKNLTISKVEPFLEFSEYKIILFSAHKLQFNKQVKIIHTPTVFNKKVIKPLRIIYELFQLMFYTIKYNPTIIHGFYTLPKGFNAFVASKLFGKRCAIYVLGGRNEIEKKYMKNWRFWKKINLYILKHANFVFTKGTKDIDFLKTTNINLNKVGVFNGSINLERFKTKGENRNIDIVYAGTLYELKNPDIILAAINRIKHIKPLNCVFLGEGIMKDELITYVKQNKLTKQIKFLGYVDNPEYYYQRAKIFIMASRTEGLSTAMLEAMACGCVPVVSDVGNLTNAAIHQKNALVVENYKDIEKYVLHLQTLLLNNELLKQYSLEAQKIVNNNYSSKAQAKIIQKTII